VGEQGDAARSAAKSTLQQYEEGWNILVTAKELDERHLARMLKRFGDFRWTRFRGVLVGRVEDVPAFLDQLIRCQEDDPSFLDPLAKLVPVDQTFTFTVETFVEQLKAAVLPYADRIGNGSFYVRLERRGHHGEIHSQQVEQELDRLLIAALSEKGLTPKIDFKDPDWILAIETIGDVCGVGALSRELRARYPFIKVP
jgi:tRNA(Ser,Leu) C12 N-acetylase TAN1